MSKLIVRFSALQLAVLAAAQATAQPGAPPSQGPAPAQATQTSAQPVAQGQEERSVAPAAWIAHGESDNITRSSSEVRDSYQAVGVRVDMTRERERLSAGLETDLQFRQYALEGIDDEQIGSLQAFADVAIVRERLTWLVSDNFGQGRPDAFAAAGPENRENVNVFSTGPQLIVPFGERLSLDTNALYTERHHEETDTLNAESMAYELGLFRETGATSRIGLIASENDVEYETGLLTYTIRSAGVRYIRALATGEVLAELGRNELEIAEDTTSGPRIELTWRRGLGSRSRLSLSATREFLDAAAAFALSGEREPITDPEDAILVADAVEQKRLEALYEIDGAKTDIAIGFARSEDLYVLDPTLDNENWTARFEMQRELSARMSIGLEAENVRREYMTALPSEGDRTIEIWLAERLGPRFVFQVNVEKYERDAADLFDAVRYELRLSYEPARRN